MPDVNSHRGGSWVETARERDMPVKYARLNRALYRHVRRSRCGSDGGAWRSESNYGYTLHATMGHDT